MRPRAALPTRLSRHPSSRRRCLAAQGAPCPRSRREGRQGARARARATGAERQADRDVIRSANAAARRTSRAKASTKYKAEAHNRSETPAREQVDGRQKVRQGVVTSDKADKTITVRIDTRPPAPPLFQDRSHVDDAARARRVKRREHRRQRSAFASAVRCRATSAGGSSASWSVPSDPERDQTARRRQLRCSRDPRHPGPRRLRAVVTRVSATRSQPPSRPRTPQGAVKKGEVVTAVVVRTKKSYGRDDGDLHRLRRERGRDHRRGEQTRAERAIFGPVARELRERNFMKIVSLAPEVI